LLECASCWMNTGRGKDEPSRSLGCDAAGCALGWTLLHSLWQGAIIAAALAAALGAARSPRIRYAAGCVAMLVMLAGFAITLIREMPESANRSQATAPAFPAWNVPVVVDAARSSSPALSAAVPWFAPFWLAGVWIFYLSQMAGWTLACRLRRRGVCCAPDRWQRELARLSTRLRLSRPIALLESSLADAPMVLGHFRPVILMPIGLLAGLPPGQIEAILMHELAHIRRHDFLVNVLQRSVEGLLFYHPAVWWISRVIRAERENCCDDVVVAMTGDAHQYAVALATLEQNRWSGRQLAVAATGGSLVKRIQRLLYPKNSSGAWTPLLAAVTLMATAAMTLAAWQAAPSPQQSAGQARADRAESSPYTLWLNEDVVYIIDDRERAAFQKLTTDEERQRFIEQFWLRRDPTPGTSMNEFKEEHYRRIRNANERFHMASGRPGWQTDRGHMYIIYGPPDEIESHPSPQAGYPYETWMYHHVEGVGDRLIVRFIDRSGTGDYRLAPGNPQ
jgi:GWxTD domain-containing protein